MEPLEEYKQPAEEMEFKLPDLEFEETPYVQICCPKCRKVVSGDDLNIQDKIGKCGSCAIVFPFGEVVKGWSSGPKKIKQEIFQPEGIELSHYKGELEMTFGQPISAWEWVLYSYAFMVPIVGASMYIGGVISLLGILLSFLPVLFCVYYAVQRYRQKVYMKVDERSLNISMKPKIWKLDKRYAAQDIDQLYVKKIVNTNLWGLIMLINEGKGQKHVQLASFRSVSEAKFLEQEIERHLMIQDVEVPEESLEQ